MTLTFVIVQDSQCNHWREEWRGVRGGVGERVGGFRLHIEGWGGRGACGEGGKVTANLRGTRVIYPYAPE